MRDRLKSLPTTISKTLEIDENWGEPGLSSNEKLFGWNSFSILANIGVASQFYLNDFSALSSAMLGIMAGLILNYFLSVNLVFKK